MNLIDKVTWKSLNEKIKQKCKKKYSKNKKFSLVLRNKKKLKEN